MRLDKFLVEAAVATRKKAREYVEEGYVKVNGVIQNIPAIEIDEQKDKISFKGEEIKLRGKVYYMFHKPSGCITARRDQESKTVFDYFQRENMNGVSHVGRLDKDTEGLLLFTNDGDFNNNLMNPKKHMDKKYLFIALGTLEGEKINRLESGILLEEGKALTKPSKVQGVVNGRYEDFLEEYNLKDFYNVDDSQFSQPVVFGYITISEGRKHQVKRMLKSVGCYVIYLKRVSIGALQLDESLRKGDYRPLREEEVNLFLRNED